MEEIVVVSDSNDESSQKDNYLDALGAVAASYDKSESNE